MTSLASKPHAEYSARIYWRVMRPWFPRFLTWNTVPYHPHQPGRPLSIRTPTAREITASPGRIGKAVGVLATPVDSGGRPQGPACSSKGRRGGHLCSPSFPRRSQAFHGRDPGRDGTLIWRTIYPSESGYIFPLICTWRKCFVPCRSIFASSRNWMHDEAPAAPGAHTGT